MKNQVGVPIFLTVIQFFIKTYQLNYIYRSVFSDKPWQQLLVWFNNLFHSLSLFSDEIEGATKIMPFLPGPPPKHHVITRLYPNSYFWIM